MNRRMHGGQTYEPISDRVVYIRHTHITDAIAVHDVLANAPELGQVSYFSPKSLSSVSASP
jgi:hypothetical protein